MVLRGGALRLVLAFIGAACATARCGDPASGGGASLTVESVEIGDRTNAETIPCRHVFGGRPAVLSLMVSGSGEPSSLKAHLFQTSGRLAVPVRKDIAVAETLEVGTGLRRIVEFRCEIPAVERRTEFLLSFFGGRADGTWFPAGRVRLMAHPAGVLDPVRAYALKGSICVHGASARLRAFLAAERVPFREAGSAAGRSDGVRIVLSENASSDDSAIGRLLGSRGTALVLFREGRGLPTIRVKRHGEAVLVDVAMAVLAGLGKDPESEEAFVEIFRMAVEGAQGGV